MADSHPIENWLPVVGCEGLYEVSDLGRIRSLGRVNFRGRWQKERILRPCVDRRWGHLRVYCWREGKRGQRRFIHHIVLEAFVGPRPGRMEACHFPDRTPANNRLSNLRWDTNAANQNDAVLHGTKPVGERHHNTKLTTENVAEILRLRKRGEKYRAIAAVFGISESGARHIVSGAGWKYFQRDHVL